MLLMDDGLGASSICSSPQKVDWKKLLLKGGIILTVILLFEIFIGNFKAFRNPGDFQSFRPDQVELTSLSETSTDHYQTGASGYPVITVNNLSAKVSTIFLDAERNLDNGYELDVSIYYKVGGSSSYTKSSAELNIIPGYEKSKCVEVDLPEGTTSFQLKLTNVQAGEDLHFSSISINHRVPFVFSWVRIGLMAGISFAIFFFVEGYRYRDLIACRVTFANVVRGLALVLSLGIIVFVMGKGGWFVNPFFQDKGSQVSQELVDSFLAGKVTLLTEPSPELVALANPYDPAARSGISLLWDHVYYNGHYYSYYGVTPVFLFFLPMHLLSGKYVFDAYGILFFSLIGCVAMAFAYKRLLEAFFPPKKIPLLLEIVVYFILFFGCGVLTNLTRPYFYEDATSSAYMCMMLCLLNLAYSGFFDKNPRPLRWWNLGFAGFWCALAVLSRATMALYAVALIAMLVVYHLKNRSRLSKKDQILLYVIALVPILPFAIFQCWYNKARFGSIFDFGIEYSLTIADFKNMSFKPVNVLASLWNFFFAVPTINFSNNHFFLDYTPAKFNSSFYFVECGVTYGLFARFPLLFVIFALPFLKNGKSWKERIFDWIEFGVPCFLMPVIIVMLTWQSGFAARYFSDFATLMLLLALFWYLGRYLDSTPSEWPKKLLPGLLFASCLYGGIASSTVLLYWVPNLYYHDYGLQPWKYTAEYYAALRQLMFWE